MNAVELYKLIEIPASVIEKLRQCEAEFRMESVEKYLAEMMVGETAAQAHEELKAHLQCDEGNFKMLLCQLECARRCYAKYQDMGIPEQIFVETMKCFQRYLHECERKTGTMYFDRSWWTYRQISMRLFRVGELEYELRQTESEKTVHLHIPSDAAFSPQNIDASLEQAKTFIERYFPDYQGAKRVCNSWLLSPQLERLLPQQSNIRDFQRRFAVQQVDQRDREYMEWIFRASRDAEYPGLPERTSLQRAAKKLLLEGGAIGSAYGKMI